MGIINGGNIYKNYTIAEVNCQFGLIHNYSSKWVSEWVSELGLTSYITALIRLFRTQAQAGLGRKYEKEKTAKGEMKDRTEKSRARQNET